MSYCYKSVSISLHNFTALRNNSHQFFHYDYPFHCIRVAFFKSVENCGARFAAYKPTHQKLAQNH